MFPDPRRRRPRFEFPGSTGAGPRHHVRMLSNLSVLLLLLLERGCADQEYMAGNQTSWVHTMFCFYLWKFRQVNSPCFSFLIYKMRTVRVANRIYNKWVITWKKKITVKVAQSCPDSLRHLDYRPPGSSIHGILQTGILEWVATSFSKGSSWLRDRTLVSSIVGRLFTIWANREAQILHESNT